MFGKKIIKRKDLSGVLVMNKSEPDKADEKDTKKVTQKDKAIAADQV